MPTIGVSVAVPEPWGSEIQRARTSFGDDAGHGIPTHVTLLPPTPLTGAILDEVHAHLDEAAAAVAPFTLTLHGTGTFYPVTPVVFLEITQGVESLELLESTIRDGVLQRELTYPFHPHVTVAHHLDEDGLARAHRELDDYHVSFEVVEFWLYVQDAADASWTPVRRYSLRG